MPLFKGKANIGRNIKELTNNGSRPRSHKQIVAIALHAAGEANKPGNRLKKMTVAKKKAKKKGYSGNNDEDEDDGYTT